MRSNDPFSKLIIFDRKVIKVGHLTFVLIIYSDKY